MESWVKVELWLTLNKYAPNKERIISLKIESTSTVEDIIRKLRMSQEGNLLITVNGRQVGRDTRLQPGDKLKFFPLLAGG